MPSDIVVFELNHFAILQASILRDLPHVLVDPKLDLSFLNPRFALTFFRVAVSVIRYRAKQAAPEQLGPAQLFKRLYILAKIRAHNPKVVLTIIDNNNYFHWACRHYPVVGSARFLAMQNGNRVEQDFLENSQRQAFHDIYFSFGKLEEKLFHSFGHTVRTFVPFGSLMADYFRSTMKDPPTERYQVGIVSSWQGELEYTPDRVAMYQNADKMHRYMATYLRETKCRAAVFMGNNAATRFGVTQAYGDELTYLKKIYSDLVEYVHRDRFSTYNGMMSSHVVVGFMTTAVKEAYGWGKKVMYCDFSGTKRFTPYEGPLVLREDSQDAFNAHLTKLLEMPQTEFDFTHAQNRRLLMTFPEGKRSHDLVRNQIDQILKGPHARH